ncbi:hypothetical protein Syun_014233 [Stephania yunnanensis]|uniref:Uncharacterized protein n=1 Tax=Stephania yunnanensis TaxID=152371 RepID=A0AAP0P8E4_9MAGN
MALRQVEGEIVMNYRNIYYYLIQFFLGLIESDDDDAFYFGDEMRPDMAHHLVSTGARSLQEMYGLTSFMRRMIWV